jgi:hypothetical protein
MSQPGALDIYDSELKAITDLHAELNQLAGSGQHNYTSFEQMVRDRFAALGFTVNVSWYTYAIGDAIQEGAMPEVTITGRTAKVAWDPDRQVHEAVHDVLGIGEDGWIKADPDTLKRFLGGQGGHSHGR